MPLRMGRDKKILSLSIPLSPKTDWAVIFVVQRIIPILFKFFQSN